MANCALSPHEFVQNTFNPVIAVLCTSKAEAMCHKNNLSFVEMVQPFCMLNNEVHLRDPTNVPYVIRHLRIKLRDMNVEPAKPAFARRMLYEAIAGTVPNMGDGSRINTIRTPGYTVQINSSTPWFEAYRDCFMESAPTCDHEFIGQFLACIFVVAASESDPLQEFANLAQQQQTHQQQSANRATNKWFFPVALRYYVLLHDVNEHDQMKTETIFKNVQETYGSVNCYLLRINSRNDQSGGALNHDDRSGVNGTANLPDPWSQFLTHKVNDADKYTESDSVSMLNENGNDSIGSFQETENGTDSMDHPLMQRNSQETSLNDFTIKIDSESTRTNNMSTLSDMIDTDGQHFGYILNENNIVPSKTGSYSSLQQRTNHTVQHGMQLTLGDVEQLKLLVQEFCLKSLLPFVEKQMNIMHEAVANRKGLHRSFFSATKKWFGGNKPGPTAGNVSSSFVIYSPESIELQVRRLGDLAFMFQNYELAYHAYHNGKRDFNSDQAWMHFAGALEMAALAVFMQGAVSQRQLPFHYFENAIATYLHTCKSPLFATRTTLLGTECLKYYERYSDAAGYFIRMTSEESDLRSALLLEQAAHCFVNLKNPGVRKFAFYMILAGHRFNKAGQKRHSLRSYKQALQIYEGQQWLLAEDHINLTAGRLCFSLGHLEDAMQCFHKLLYDGSVQCEIQQAYYLREYLAICNHLWADNDHSGDHQLPLPVIDSQNCKVLFGERSDYELDTLGKGEEDDIYSKEDLNWYRLEEFAAAATGSTIHNRPLVHWHSSSTDNSQNPVAIVDELITVELIVRNPLKVPLCMTKLHLLWSFDSESEDPYSTASNNSDTNSTDETLETGFVDELLMEGMQSLTIDLVVRPHRTGTLRIRGIAYNLTMTQQQVNPCNETITSISTNTTGSTCFVVSGMQPFKIIGPRLNRTKADKCAKIYRDDKRLEPIIVPPMPRLVVRQLNFPTSLLCGQVASVNFEFINRGQVGLRRLILVTSHPQYVALGCPSPTDVNNESLLNNYDSPPTDHPQNFTDIHVFAIPLPDNWDSLEPGQRFWVPVWLRGPDTAGTHTLNFLFYYETANVAEEQKTNKHITLRHRIYRCHAKLRTTSVLSASVIAISGTKPVDDDSLSQSLILAVEVSNGHQLMGSPTSSNVQLSVSQISCVSRDWKLKPITQSILEDISIAPKESVHLCFRAVAINANILGNDTGQPHFSNVNFKGREKDKNVTPCLEFNRRTMILNFNDRVNSDLRPDNMMEINEAIPECNYSPSIALSVIIFWEALVDNGKIVCGQHQLNLTNVDVFVSTRPETKTLEEPWPAVVPFPTTESTLKYSMTQEAKARHSSSAKLLRYFLFAASEVQHNFSTSHSCIVPVFLVLYNCADVDVITTVDVSSQLATSTVGVQPYPEAGRFVWVGATRVKRTLTARETNVLRLKACFFASGTYALNGVTVHAKISTIDAFGVVTEQPETLQSGIGQLVIVGTASNHVHS